MSMPSGETGLEEQFFPTSSARLQRTLPWISLLRCFRIALDYRRLTLAVLAVVVWAGGDIALQSLGPDRLQRGLPDDASWTEHPHWPWHAASLPTSPAATGGASLSSLLEHPWGTTVTAFQYGETILRPWQRVFRAAWALMWPQLDSELRWYNALLLAWGLIVCGLFGGAICRMAAVEYAAFGEGSARPAIRFTLARWRSYLGAPLIPVIGLIVFWIPNLLAGLIARIPYVGDTLVGVFWIVPLVCGLVLALLIVGVCAAWPLMVAAVSTDSSDAFDALSRSYSYIFNHPWYAAFLTGLVLLYGSALLFFVTAMTEWTLNLTALSVECGLGTERAAQLFRAVPSSPLLPDWHQFAPFDAQDQEGLGLSTSAQAAVGFWTLLVLSIPSAFVFSFFWTAVTVIYCLLRRREDATPLTELAPDSPAPPDPVPLVGVPAAQAREEAAAPPADD